MPKTAFTALRAVLKLSTGTPDLGATALPSSEDGSDNLAGEYYFSGLPFSSVQRAKDTLPVHCQIRQSYGSRIQAV